MPSKTIVVDGITYVQEGSVKSGVPAEDLKGLKYKIVRTQSAGVFAGYVKERVGREVTMLNARRLWYWDGAASLSQLSQDGVTKPSTCKFPCEVPEVELTEAIEILPCTETARLNICAVPVWKME